MSDYRVVRRVGEALRDVLLACFDEERDAGNDLLPGTEARQRILLAAPVTDKKPPTPLSLWLYLASENEHTKNRPPTVVFAADPKSARVMPPPLTLCFYYLITPTPEPSTEAQGGEVAETRAQEILGLALAAFYDRPIVALVEPERNFAEELHLSLCRLTLEEMTRVWEALKQPYRLSLCIRVNVARIDSSRVSRGALILERRFDYGEVLRRAS